MSRAANRTENNPLSIKVDIPGVLAANLGNLPRKMNASLGNQNASLGEQNAPLGNQSVLPGNPLILSKTLTAVAVGLALVLAFALSTAILCTAGAGQAYAKASEALEFSTTTLHTTAADSAPAAATPALRTTAADSAPAAATPTLHTASTSSAIERKLSHLNLKLRAKLQYDGWQPAVKSGKVAGTKTTQGFRMMRAKLTGLNGVSGSILYKTYVPGAGWSRVVKNWKASGSNERAITAVRIRLKGTVAKYYDVYYRTYFKGYGWLDWAKNSKVSGTKSTFGYVSALQVKLVKKTAKFTGKTTTPYVKNRWQAIERKYRNKKAVTEILEVRYTGGTRARVLLRHKVKSNKWKTVLTCPAYVGSRGVGKTREGLSRTPSGDFEITDAFGIKPDPGSLLPYTQVTRAMYWCGDRAYYNQLIDINDSPHDCSGEHLIDYVPHYNYGLFFDYNTNPVRYGAGSAFFVHCTGGQTSTGGCIAVSRDNMISIIRNVSSGARICIYSA